MLLKEQFVKLSELDVAYWAYWLSTSGYSSQVSGVRRSVMTPLCGFVTEKAVTLVPLSDD